MFESIIAKTLQKKSPFDQRRDPRVNAKMSRESGVIRRSKRLSIEVTADVTLQRFNESPALAREAAVSSEN
jgi:hypothetical protein